MKLSARTRYAARILLELARNKSVSPMSAAVISQRTGISVQFIEQILKPLKHKGVTSSVRGAAGGHWLAKPADQVTLGDVVRIMEGEISLVAASNEKKNKTPHKEACPTHMAWQKVSRVLALELDSISIADLLSSEPRRQLARKPRQSDNSVAPELVKPTVG